MTKIDELKQMIAETLKVSPGDLNNDYSLKTGKLKTSAGSVILGNIVKKVYGTKVDCKKITTFGELIEVVEGESIVSVNTPSEASAKEDDISCNEKSSEAFATQVLCGGPVCGIDIQEIDIFPKADDYWKESFYIDNFTDDEIAYCVTTDSPRHSFAGRWCVKEALHKCCPKYFNTPLKDIQVVKRANGSIRLEVRRIADIFTPIPYACSLSHCDNYAVGMVSGFEEK